MGIWGTESVRLAPVPIVGNAPLAIRDFSLEFLSVHCYVMGCCRLGTLEPNNLVLVHMHANFIH
jgi:hypothetical protein